MKNEGMKKILLMALLCLGANVAGFACTNFIVGKKASVDGSVMCSYSADDYGMFQSLAHYPAGKHAKGEMVKIFDWDTNEYHGEIPQAAETWNVIGNINEWQVTIGETTFGGREEMVDSTGIIDYGSLIYLALQRSKTAREAIKVMTTLAETYGYNSEGETFTICDPNEAWIMEMMGCGPGSKSVVWVALRVPDDAICAHANQSRIRTFNPKDKQNVMCSKNVVKYARHTPSPTSVVADSARLACGHSLICIATTWLSMLIMQPVRWQMPNRCLYGLCPSANSVFTTWRWQCATTMRAPRSLSTVTSEAVFGKCLIVPHRCSLRWMARAISTSVL